MLPSTSWRVTKKKINDLIASFPSTYNIQTWCAGKSQPSVIISTIPGSKPMDNKIDDLVSAALRSRDDFPAMNPRILLEMAYTPKHTDLMSRAEQEGWKTIPGLEVLTAQGWYQFQLWTGITPLYSTASAAVIDG